MMIALVVIFAVFGYASSTELLCQCPPTYGPMKIHGSVRCANPLTFHIIPCTYTNKEPECVCYKDYDSQQVNGKTYCINKHFFHILPCNTFMQPTCDCINYTEIQIGSDGVPKCALHVGEKVAKTWACENSDEWDKFYELP